MSINRLIGVPVSVLDKQHHPQTDSPERILDAATRLFADQGFHGTTTRQISAETGLNVATIHHHVGTKGELYKRVIERLFAKEEEIIDGLLDRMNEHAAADPDLLRRTLDALIAGFVGLARSRPERQRLYARRWLEPADELREREVELTLQLYRRLAEFIEKSQRAGLVRDDLDVENFLRSFDWMIIGYFTSGAFDWESLRTDPNENTNAERFIRYLQEYAARMLGLSEESTHVDRD